MAAQVGGQAPAVGYRRPASVARLLAKRFAKLVGTWGLFPRRVLATASGGGKEPANASYKITPREYTSAPPSTTFGTACRSRTAARAASCSGAM